MNTIYLLLLSSKIRKRNINVTDSDILRIHVYTHCEKSMMDEQLNKLMEILC